MCVWLSFQTKEALLAALRSMAYAENFHGGVHSVAYGGHLYLVCTVYDVTIWCHAHVSKPTFCRSFL